MASSGAAIRRDALVIGAGIVGAACAYRLAEAGLAVTVLEREAAPAAGSTGRSAAGVRVQFSEAVNVLLSAASIDEYRALPQASYRPIGYLFLVPEAQWTAHSQGLRLQQSLGMPVQELSADEAAARVGASPVGLEGASWSPIDGVVDPHGIALNYLAALRASGRGHVALNAGVDSIEQIGSSTQPMWQVDTAAGRWQAPVVLNCAGAWSGEVAALAGLHVPVGPARRMVFATGPMPERANAPMCIDAGSGLWWRPEGQRLIFGLSNPADTGFEEGIDWEWLEPTAEAALARFPWFEQVAIDRRASWWGYYEVTPDHQPVLGPMPGAPGWFNACGFSGHGVQQAAAVGRVMAAIITDRKPFIDVWSLRIERFDDTGGMTRRESLIV